MRTSAFYTGVLLCCRPWRLMRSTSGRAGSVSCHPGCVVFALALLASDVSLAFVVAPSARTGIMSTGINAVSTTGEVKQHPSLPTTVKGILFDMDGTLTDSDTLHFEAYRETFLKVRGLPSSGSCRWRECRGLHRQVHRPVDPLPCTDRWTHYLVNTSF